MPPRKLSGTRTNRRRPAKVKRTLSIGHYRRIQVEYEAPRTSVHIQIDSKGVQMNAWLNRSDAMRIRDALAAAIELMPVRKGARRG